VEWSPQAACLQPEPMEPLLQVEWSPQAAMSSQRAAWLPAE